MINIDVSSYTYPVLGAPEAYIPPHDVFELRDYKFSKNTAGDMYVKGTLHMECGLLEHHIRRKLCRAYMLTWSPGKMHRGCHPIDVGSFSLTLEGAAIYADQCNAQCVVVAETDIRNFFDPRCHNTEYGTAPLEVKRGMPLAVSGVVRTKKKAESVGSAIIVESDPKLSKDISFVVECGDSDDYIHIKARPDTKRQIDMMHKTDRALFDNVVLAPVLAHALRRMSEYRGSAQWASALAEKCESEGIGQNDIDEQLHATAQKLLYKKTALFERLKWDEGSRRGTDVEKTLAREDDADDEEDYY